MFDVSLVNLNFCHIFNLCASPCSQMWIKILKGNIFNWLDLLNFNLKNIQPFKKIYVS